MKLAFWGRRASLLARQGGMLLPVVLVAAGCLGCLWHKPPGAGSPPAPQVPVIEAPDVQAQALPLEHRWAEVVALPGQDDPQLGLIADRLLGRNGVLPQYGDIPKLAWQTYGRHVQACVDTQPTAFNCWLLAQIQLKYGEPVDGVSAAEAALVNAQRAVDLADGSAMAHCGLAQAYRALKRYDEARAECDIAEQLDAELVAVYCCQGDICYAQEEYEQAIAAYTQASVIDPLDCAPYLSLGHAYYSLKDYDQAAEVYRKATLTKQTSPCAYCSLATAYYRLGYVDEAIEEFEESIKVSPNHILSYIWLGDIYFEQQRYEEALEAYQQAAQLDPKRFWPHYSLGLCYYRSSLLGKARDEFELAVELNPKHAHAQMALGMVYFELNDYERARPAFDRAIELSEPGTCPYEHSREYLARIDAGS